MRTAAGGRLFGAVTAAAAASAVLAFPTMHVAAAEQRVVEVDLEGSSVDEASQSSVRSTADLQCGIWLAPSTLKGAGLGMFAGADFAPGQELLVGGDSVIAISDIVQHNSNHKFGGFLWDEYTWNAHALKMDSEGHFQIEVASEGFGAAANSFLPIYNVEEWHPLLTPSGLHRASDPGAGASTVFHRRKSTAKLPIAAGQELFVSCTYRWCKHAIVACSIFTAHRRNR